MDKLQFLENPILSEKIYSLVENKANWSKLPVEDKNNIVQRLIKGCRNCKLSSVCDYSPVPSILVPNSRAIFIGRNPTKSEAQVQELFPERSHLGRIFGQYLTYLSLSISECSVMNVANCYVKGGFSPTPAEFTRCIGIKPLEWEIIGDKYEFIFPLGNDGVKYVLGTKAPGVLNLIGKYFTREINGREVKIVPLPHPSYVQIQPELKQEISSVLKEIGNSVIQNR